MQTLKKSLIQFILLGLLLTIALGINYLYAWTGPTKPPPDGNVPAPINVSTVPQVKDGNLGVGKSGNKAKDPPGLTVYGNQFITKWLNVGSSTTPNFPLVVNGTTKTDRVYTSKVCAIGGRKCKNIYPATDAPGVHYVDGADIAEENVEEMRSAGLEEASSLSKFGAAMAVKSVITGTTDDEWNARVNFTYEKFKDKAPYWEKWKDECYWDRTTERFPTDNDQLVGIKDWVMRTTTRKDLVSMCGRGMCRAEFSGRSVSDTVHCGGPIQDSGVFDDKDDDSGEGDDIVPGLGCKGNPEHFTIVCIY